MAYNAVICLRSTSASSNKSCCWRSSGWATRPTRCRSSSRSRQQTGRKVARGALYTALDRLEAKGCLRSRVGDPLPERGGRARRYFTVTPAAVRALKASRLALMRLWNGLESLQ